MKANAYSPFSTLWKNIPRIFHAMEDFLMEEYFVNLPRYGNQSSTVWKKVFAPARTIPYPDI
jgi:hypothetical protein